MTGVLLLQFDSGEAMLRAARRARELGCSDIDGHAPYALEGMEEAIGVPRSKVPRWVLAGGLIGAVSGYLMMFWCNAINYPLNVGGRPLNSYPAFIPITFEMTVLFGSIAGVLGMLRYARLPKPYHPVFEDDAFRSASVNKFWLSIRLPSETESRPVREGLEAFEPTHQAWIEGR